MKPETTMIDRRDLIQRATMLLGGAISGGTVLGVLSGCAALPQEQPVAPASLAAGRFLTIEEMATVAAMADQILPRTTTPGALDVGVPAFVDRLLADFHPDREKAILRAGLARAQLDARNANGGAFATLPAAQMTTLMKVYDREAVEQTRRTLTDTDPPPHFFRMMKEMTIVGFFTSEVGASQVLKYAAVPGPWKADVPYSEIGRTWAT